MGGLEPPRLNFRRPETSCSPTHETFFEKVIKRVLGRDNDIARTQIEQIIEPAFVKFREGAKQRVSGRVAVQ